MFGQGSFINSASATPEEIARKRAEIAAMMPRFGNARYVGEGLGQLFMGIGLGRQQKALDGQEREGRASAQERLNAVMGGGIQGRAQPGGFSVLGAMPMEPVAAPDPASPEGIASDAMAALGRATYTPGDRESFVKAMMPHALRVSQETGLDPRLVIAQAAQETGWGKSAPNNNYFGIKSHGRGGGGTFATTEFVNGQPITINDSFRGYGSMGESAADYARFLQENPRYSDMLAAPDLESQIAALGASGYATDPNYANSVASIANSIQVPGMDAAPVGGMNSPQMAAATIPTDALMSIVMDQWQPPEVRAQAQAMLDQQMKMNDPAYTMGLRADELAIQKAEAELDAIRNPTPEWRDLTNEEEAQRGLNTDGVYQIGRDGSLKTIVEPPKAPEDPTAAREYNFYAQDQQARGLPVLSFDEWSKSKAEAGASKTEISLGGNSDKFTEETDKAAATRFAGYVEAGNTASRMMGDINALVALAPMIGTGKEAQFKAALGPYAEAFGVDVEGLGEAEAFQSIVDRMAPGMRPAGSGSSSDFDAKQFLSSLPQLGRTPEGNQIIMQTLTALQEHQIAAANIASRSMLPPDDPNFLRWQDAEKQIRELGDPYTLFRKNKGKFTTDAGSAPPPVDAPKLQWRIVE